MHEEDETHFSDHRSMLDITGAVRTWLQICPWDHGLDEVLTPSYLDTNYLAFRQGDRVEIQASDFSWMLGFLIVSVNRSARTVSALLKEPPTFLLRSSDRSELYLMDAFQKLENDFRDNKIRREEYEARRKVLESLRDRGQYPSAWLADKLTQLNRALDAERLTRQQHDRARQELFEVMSADQMDEVNAIIRGEPPKAAVPSIALGRHGRKSRGLAHEPSAARSRSRAVSGIRGNLSVEVRWNGRGRTHAAAKGS
jgi:hypothetical protein